MNVSVVAVGKHTKKINKKTELLSLEGDTMKTEAVLTEYLQNKREIGILETDLQHLNSITFVKVSKFGDDEAGGVSDIEDKYWRLMEEKKEIEFRLQVLKRDVARVEKVLELISMTHPHEVNAMLLRHVHNKKVVFIEQQIGFSRNIICQKIKFAEREFERLMSV